MDNLRWDVSDDLARLIGEGPARELARLGRVLSAGLRKAVSAFSGLARRSEDASAR
jgi:ubiquinone biosynthesis protein UbiJ